MAERAPGADIRVAVEVNAATVVGTFLSDNDFVVHSRVSSWLG